MSTIIVAQVIGIPRHAILNGHVYLHAVVSYFFLEVNGIVCTWIMDAQFSIKKEFVLLAHYQCIL
jgi:hypothetical protein